MSEFNPYMIYEFDPRDPSRVTLRRVTKEEFTAAWIEMMNPLIDDVVGQLSTMALSGIIPPDAPPADPKQRAHERSKTDRRRKSRRGRYKWGGPLD